MASVKQILHRKNSSGTYDNVYLQTTADMVKVTESGTDTVADKLNNMVGKSTIVEKTLLASGWTTGTDTFSYRLAVSGVTATSNQEILPGAGITYEQLLVLQNANIQDGGQEAGYITLVAYGNKPEIDIPIRIMMRGD